MRATTLYTPAACQQSRKHHHTRAVVCPRCITVASYSINSCCCCWTLRSAGLRVSAAVSYMHAATGTSTHMFHNVVVWYHKRMIQCRMLCHMFFSSFLRHSPRDVPEGDLVIRSISIPCMHMIFILIVASFGSKRSARGKPCWKNKWRVTALATRSSRGYYYCSIYDLYCYCATTVLLLPLLLQYATATA